MLWVVTFSVFLPSLTSSSVVWLNPSAGQKPTSIAYSQIFFMIGLPWLKPEFPIWNSILRILRLACPRHNEFACRAGPRGDRRVPTANSQETFIRWDEKAGLRRDAIRSQ